MVKRETQSLDGIEPKRVPEYLWALFLAVIRAKIVKDEFDTARELFERHATEARAAGRRPGDSEYYRALLLFELWLASVQVIVEGYERSHQHPDSVLADTAIDELLASDRARALKKFRNSVFHVELREHPDIMAVLNKYNDFTALGSELMTKIGQLIMRQVGSTTISGKSAT